MRHVRVPIREVNGDRWGALSMLTKNPVELVAEVFKLKNDSYSFVGGHRVRLYKLRQNVHFKVPDEMAGVELDISGVAPGTAPPRRQGRR